MTGNSGGWTPGGKILALLGVFFGVGFMTGFFTGYGYRPASPARGGATAVNASAQPAPEGGGVSRDAAPEDPKTEYGEDEAYEENSVPPDSGLALTEHELGEDENGLFVSGTVVNRSDLGYDAVRVTFDLCDATGKAYGGVTDVTYDRMVPGDSWGFTIYIPYSEMGLFSSYRLQSIIGASR
jgi:hypothetical protein